jgi:hypothetical protein
MVCLCGAAIQIEVSNEDQYNAVWVLIHRYVNAHVSCGFVARLPEKEDSSTYSKKIKLQGNPEPQ